MSFWSLDPQNIDKLMMMNNWVNFKQTKIDVTWFYCHAWQFSQLKNLNMRL